MSAACTAQETKVRDIRDFLHRHNEGRIGLGRTPPVALASSVRKTSHCPERCKWPTPYLARALRVFLPGRNISSTTHHPIDCMTINLYLLRASMTFFATAITPAAWCKSFASCPSSSLIAYGRPVFHAERSPVRLASLSANT